MNIKLLIYVSILLTSVACTKKQWKETASNNVNVLIKSDAVLFDDNSLQIDSVRINLSNTTVSGQRIQANDIYLVQPAQSVFLSNANNNIQIAQYDIPQGTYESLILTLGLDNSLGESLTIYGTYISPGNEDKLVKVSISLNQAIVKKILESAQETVLITKESSYITTIKINVPYVFQDITAGMWNAAIPSFVEGYAAFEINPSTNSAMYYEIVNKVDESFEVTIN